MLVERAIAPVLKELFSSYPVVTLTGPRQSGKTTLCRTLFPELPYFNLERPDLRLRIGIGYRDQSGTNRDDQSNRRAR